MEDVSCMHGGPPLHNQEGEPGWAPTTHSTKGRDISLQSEVDERVPKAWQSCFQAVNGEEEASSHEMPEETIKGTSHSYKMTGGLGQDAEL